MKMCVCVARPVALAKMQVRRSVAGRMGWKQIYYPAKCKMTKAPHVVLWKYARALHEARHEATEPTLWLCMGLYTDNDRSQFGFSLFYADYEIRVLNKLRIANIRSVYVQ